MFPDAAVVRAMAARLEGDLERALNVLLELGVVGAFDPVRRTADCRICPPSPPHRQGHMRGHEGGVRFKTAGLIQ